MCLGLPNFLTGHQNALTCGNRKFGNGSITTMLTRSDLRKRDGRIYKCRSDGVPDLTSSDEKRTFRRIAGQRFAVAGVPVKNVCDARTSWYVTEVTCIWDEMFPNVRISGEGSGREKGRRAMWRMHLLGVSPYL